MLFTERKNKINTKTLYNNFLEITAISPVQEFFPLFWCGVFLGKEGQSLFCCLFFKDYTSSAEESESAFNKLHHTKEKYFFSSFGAGL